jgi:hypothetical protein
MPVHSLRTVFRALTLGLMLGLLGSAFILLGAAVLNVRKTCDAPGTQECDWELSTAEDIARLQCLAAIGCGLVSGGLFLAIRKKVLPPRP